MLNNSQLIDILGLLGLNYYVEDGRTIIIDTNNEDATYIEKDKNGYKFTIGDITCHFNNLSVQLDINDKRLVFVGRNIGYQRKLPNSSFNATSFRILNNSISFYNNNDGVAQGVIFYYDKDFKYDGMKKSISITDENGEDKEDIEVYPDERLIAKHVIRRYGTDGKMVRGSVYSEDVILPLADYINDEIKTNPIIPEVLSEFEETLPGITDYYSKNNPNLKDIANQVKFIK